jgi:hypothetical protein
MNIVADPVDIAHLNLDNLTLRPPDARKFGAKSFLNYNRGPTRLALPALRAPFGAKINTPEFNDTIELNLTFDNLENSPETRQAFENLEALDNKVRELVKANLDKFFPNKPIKADKEYYKSFIQRDEKGKYPPRIKLYIETDRDDPQKILSWMGKPFLKAYDNTPVPVTRANIAAALPRNSIIRSVIEVAHVFGSSGRSEVSLKWRLSHAKLATPPAQTNDSWDFNDADLVATSLGGYTGTRGVHSNPDVPGGAVGAYPERDPDDQDLEGSSEAEE